MPHLLASVKNFSLNATKVYEIIVLLCAIARQVRIYRHKGGLCLFFKILS